MSLSHAAGEQSRSPFKFQDQLYAVPVIGLLLLLIVLSIVRADLFLQAMHAGTRLAFKDFGTLRERMGHGAVFVGLIGLYVAWISDRWKLTKRKRTDDDAPMLLRPMLDRSTPVASLLRIALPIMLLAFLVYPYSGDVRLYLHYGDMANHGVNPLTVRADAYASPWSNTLAWGQRSTYGPVGIALFSLPARLLHDSTGQITSWTQTIAPLYSFKLICLAMHLATTLLIAKALAPREDRWDWALLYGINPVVLFELVSNAHIDAGVALLLVVGILSLRSNRLIVAAGALVAATLVKTVALIWLPLLGLDMLRARRYRAAAVTIVGGVLLVFALHHTLLPNAKSWNALLNSGVGLKVSESLPSVGSRLMMVPGLDVSADTRMAVVATFASALKIVFVLLSACLAWRFWTRREWSLIGAIAVSTLLLFILACPWYRPWYATILLLPPVFLSMGYWNRVAVLALVLGGSFANAMFAPSLTLDLITILPATFCVAIGAIAELRAVMAEPDGVISPLAALRRLLQPDTIRDSSFATDPA